MFGRHFLLELTTIKRLRVAAFLALDQCGTDRLYVGLACLVGNGDCFACCTHKNSPTE